jgi:ParB-like chromosome segregation protein Spo0J
MSECIPIASIVVGERHRKTLRNIDGLAASIEAVGLLHPIVVTPDKELIAGARRIAAFRQLGRTEIPVHVVPIEDIVHGEFAENVDRDDFTPSEMVAIGRAVEPLLREQAKERKREGGRSGGKASGKLPEASNGQARDHVARYCGVSGKTYERAKAVVAAAEREPERFAALVEEMDRSRRVNGVHKKLRRPRRSARSRRHSRNAAPIA